MLNEINEINQTENNLNIKINSINSINSNIEKFKEISSNKKYIRFDEILSSEGSIKYSFKAFDTNNGIEIVWQKIILSNLSPLVQQKISRSANYLKEVRHQNILEYLDIWLIETPLTLNLITRYLDSLKQ